MTSNPCGCTTGACDCCTGIQKLTPQPVANRPGLDALVYRAGTHAAFLQSMKARLTTMSVEAANAAGQTSLLRPLAGLTTRDPGDFSIALLDGWATVADVLTFYQERIANEGYLRTATERRSILELARLVGYELRPGVAASVFLAYLLDDNQVTPTTIPAGARSQSIPGPGELPQAFETSEDLTARVEWNNLQVRLTRPQNITLANVLSVARLYVAGGSTNLKAGDSLLFVFDDSGDLSAVRTVLKVEPQFEAKRTLIEFQALPAFLTGAVSLLANFWSFAAPLVKPGTAENRMVAAAARILRPALLGDPTMSIDEWLHDLSSAADAEPEEPIKSAFDVLASDLTTLLKNPPAPASGVVYTEPSSFVTPLLRPAKAQAPGSLAFRRNLQTAFKSGGDANSQLLVNFAPQLRGTFYTAWSNANVNRAQPTLKGVFALRLEAPLFGTNVPKMVSYHGRVPNQPKDWTEWPLSDDEALDALFLDKAYEAIQPDSYVVIQDRVESRSVHSVQKVLGVETLQRTDYGMSGKTTRLTLSNKWRPTGKPKDLGDLRPVLVRGQSEPLTLVEAPVTENVTLTEADVKAGKGIELAGLHMELASGRWVILSGERSGADIPGVSGVRASELLMISGIRQDFDPTLPGDKTHTTLLLATPTAHSYKRDTVTINANVVKATHGETRKEALGNGDGSQVLQTFALKQPPLTFVAASNPAGVASTLEVYVNDVRWHEADTLAGSSPKDHAYIVRTGDDDTARVTFGNGAQGARLPTGQNNVKAVYRNGIGRPGNVKAEQISLLQTRPLGVKSVINPLPASGGADRESRDQARENAPLALMSLDRLVSVQDYADFTRTFAGIGKAVAAKLSDGQRQLVALTIAGADDAPIDESSDLYRNLSAALRQFGDPDMPVRLIPRELVVLVLNANVRLAPDYQWEPVVQAIRARLLDSFGFQKRALGQPALLSEIVATIQNTEGVAYVDVDSFGGIPERRAGDRGQRELLTLDQIAETVEQIVSGPPDKETGELAARAPAPSRVMANLADFENRGLRPAQLALFSPAVPDTLILNQID